jgi:hypothetical protein
LRRRPSERRLAHESATRRRIGQALALDAEERTISSLQIVNPESDPIVVPEVELRSVPMQVRFGDVEIAAVNPAFRIEK